ncbi:MAG: NAD-dependent epimerase/dehydratase family protein [Alphaproteobacteria bacterium]|nr:NAD-dependent epimerase/dehydratase family protein [Alphaproteobacteria bacterium]
MQAQNILITGASGLVGFPLSRLLVARGDRVVALDPAPLPESIDGINHIQQGFGGYDSIYALLETHGITKIVHAGGISGPMLANDAPQRITAANLRSTIDLAEAAYRTNISRFVYCSSGSAYGETPVSPVREDTAFRPTSLYGATKAASDLILMAYRNDYGVDAIGLRYSTVYGPRRATDCAIRTMIEDAIAGRPTRLHQGAGRRWPYVYVDDVVTATVAALDAPPTTQYAYNVAGPDYPSMAQIAELVWSEFRNADIEIKGSPDDPVRGQFDLSAAERDLNWTPRWTIEAGVASYIDWLRENAVESDG